MTGKLRLYIGLLVIGLAVIGGGIWMLAKSPPRIDIPEEPPVIYEQVGYVMRGQFSYLYIYGDGSIIYIEEKGLRPPGGHPTRTWKTGKLTSQQLDSLLAYLENSGLVGLDEYYQFPGITLESGAHTASDMSYTISVNSGNLSKKVNAVGYLAPNGNESYPDMPPPLNEIYGRLRVLAMTTEEIYTETIRD